MGSQSSIRKEQATQEFLDACYEAERMHELFGYTMGVWIQVIDDNEPTILVRPTHPTKCGITWGHPFSSYLMATTKNKRS